MCRIWFVFVIHIFQAFDLLGYIIRNSRLCLSKKTCPVENIGIYPSYDHIYEGGFYTSWEILRSTFRGVSASIFIQSRKKSTLVVRRLRSIRRDPTIWLWAVLKIRQFSAAIFGLGTTPAPGGLGLQKPLEKFAHSLGLTAQPGTDRISGSIRLGRIIRPILPDPVSG